jgi:hypothetical protein
MKITSRNRSQPVALQGKSTGSLFLWLVFLFFIVFPVSTVLVSGYPRHALAAGTVYYASPGDNLTAKLQALRPGDTLIFHDGTYTSLRLDPANPFTNPPYQNTALHGTATAPITLKAADDGKVIFDASSNIINGVNEEPIFVSDSSYVLLQGFVARNSPGDVVYLWGGGVQPDDHITLQRITAYNAGAGNYHVFDVALANNVLLEDDAGWGRGRYIFLAYHANTVTFRRTWARWTTQSNFSSAPRSCYGVYGSSNTTLENTICTHDIPDRPSQDFFTAAWETSDGPATNNTRYLGVMFFDNWEGLWINDSVGQNTQISNSYFENNYQQGPYTTSHGHGDGIMWSSPHGGSITNSTFVNNEVGISRQAGSPTISNSVFVNNGTAILDDPGHSHLAFWQNHHSSIASTDTQLDPGYEVKKYGRGAYLFVPACSPLTHAGPGGTAIGANILYRYQDGVLTNQPLWPWPMEERIKAETGSSVTWASAGGIWNTLDGVYSQGTGSAACGTSSQAPTPIPQEPATPTPIKQEPAWSFAKDIWGGGIAAAVCLMAGVLLYRSRRRFSKKAETRQALVFWRRKPPSQQ